ncbi:MAG: GAF domain-containing protein [Ignavibacteriales bacterium]|nr:GAF domain-containing protein [Ignavibacteriales bacterium]
MSESIIIDNYLSDQEKYLALIPQLKILIDENDYILTSLSNFTAALKQTFDKISWVGFYLYTGRELILGPFQGKIACTKIEIGKGVCGTAAIEKQTVIVPDVEKFPGHIACDSESKSEIVIPLIKNDKLYGVLDLDSCALNSFDETDKKYLESICKLLLEKLNFDKLIIT